jgi:hypothetical protein
MKTIIILQLSGSILFMALSISCSDDEKEDVVGVSPYSWKESNLSANGVFTYALLEIGDDGNLYAYGISSVNEHTGFYKLPGSMSNTWTKVGEFNVNQFSNVQSFTVYHGSIYYHVFDKLYKIEGAETKEILSGGMLGGIEICKDELVIIGGGLKVSNDSYTMVSYDGTTFEPISKEMTTSRIIPANDKIYLPGFPSVVYDGKSLTPLNFYGSFVAVDEEEQMYYSDTYNNRLFLSRTSNYGQKEVLGDYIIGMGAILHDLEFFDGTIFLVGVDNFRGYSKVYFLKDDKWIEVPTEHAIYDVIVYDNRLIASSLDGKIYELGKD